MDNNQKKGQMKKNQKAQWLFLTLANNLVADLGKRSQEIIKKRFGLSINKGETLEKIGLRYGVTRERIRQVITESLKKIVTKIKKEEFEKVQQKIIFTINKNNGIIKETDIIKKFNLKEIKEANAIKFFVICSQDIYSIEEKGLIEKSWLISQEIVQDVKKIILTAEKIFQKEKNILSEKDIVKKINLLNPSFSSEQILNFLRVSVRVKNNNFNKWGLSVWDEINPKGTRERVHLLLKEENKPLHFVEIAQLIDKYKIGKKKAHPQTIHNELIKDNRFVLIGRGVYALKEWGYSKGTIKEVIRDVLKKYHQPMDKEIIIREVLKVRKVKKATVIINLNNSQLFQKKNNLYELKK